jgi:hypothetical protein
MYNFMYNIMYNILCIILCKIFYVKYYHNIGFQAKAYFFRRKLSNIVEICSDKTMAPSPEQAFQPRTFCT